MIIFATINYLMKIKNKSNYYINEESEKTETVVSNKSSTTGKYKTQIITDNVYSGISVKNINDANKLIIQDSINQKKSDYSQEIINIENDIINKYSITAVNLKEMDVDFARELENVIENIF